VHKNIQESNDHDLMNSHERLHQLYGLGKLVDDSEVCQRAMREHDRHSHEMIQRGINHPHLDNMDDSIRTMEAANPNTHEKSIMLSFALPRDVLEEISEDDGEKKKDLHMTLLYLGKMADWNKDLVEQLPEMIKTYAANSQPLSGTISGIGRFAASESSDDMDVLYRSVDIPGLPSWRQDLVEILAFNGFRREANHGYTPHITIKYLDPEESLSVGKQQHVPVVFDAIVCNIGDETHRFPLKGEPDKHMSESHSLDTFSDNSELLQRLIDMQFSVREAIKESELIQESSGTLEKILEAVTKQEPIVPQRVHSVIKTVERDSVTGLITRVIETQAAEIT